MNKIFRYAAVAAAAATLVTAAPARADVLMNENFDYPVGNLYTSPAQGAWWQAGSVGDAYLPVGVTATPLTYAGYQNAAKGNAAHSSYDASYASMQKCMKYFGADADAIKDGSIYLSALIKVNTPANDNIVISFYGPGYSGAKDKASGTNNGRIFVKKSDDATKFSFGVSRGANTSCGTVDNLNVGETYLVVLKYEYVDGTKNDIVTLWVNPVASEKEPSSGKVVSTDATGADFGTRGILGVYLHQGKLSGRDGGDVTIDAVRMATTWAELFDGNGGGTGGGGDDPDPKPGDAVITASVPSLAFDATYQGIPQSKQIVVKATGLTGPVSVAIDNTAFTAAQSTIAASDAMSADGYALDVTMNAKTAGEQSAVLTLSADGAEPVKVNLTGSVVKVVSAANSMFVTNAPGDGADVYRYEGLGATVTFVDQAARRIYAQDMNGGICFDFSMFDIPLPAVAAGEHKIKNVLGIIEADATGANIFMPMMADMTVSASTPREPLEVSAAEIARDGATYIFRLVKLTDDVTFNSVADGQKFAASALRGVSGSTDVSVMPFAATDLIGQPVPASTPVTGISYSPKAVTVRPRSAADVVVGQEAGAPEMDVTSETLYTEKYANIGQVYPFARFTVVTKNLEKPASVYISGNGASMFALDHETIEPGTGTTVVTVSYVPTAIGTHTARITFDAMPTELSCGYSLNAMAIDPQNLPEVSVDITGLTEFKASVGTTHQQTLAVVTKNMPAYGTARLTKASGAFQLNSTSLLNNMSNRLVVTFNPKKAGTYTDEIELVAPGGNTVTVPLKGVADGDTPVEDKQGDSLPLDDSAPLTYMVEPMNDAVNFQPLSIAGWKNLAMEGTRAWWGAEFAADGDTPANKAARVTLYDSQAATDIPSTMMLVTPALDYAGTVADARFLTFRVMGQYMPEEGCDALEVCYIEQDADNQLYIEPFGVGIPTGASVNGDWNDYVVDLHGLELADVFHIGFRWSGLRGRNNTVAWFVDDVTWGRTDVPFIRPSQQLYEFTVAPQTDHVMNFSASGLNLIEPIKLKMVGSHAGKFTLSSTEIPATGGSFSVSFNSADAEPHTAFVEMTSGSAPKSYIEIHGNVDSSVGIDTPSTDADATAIVVEGRTIRVVSAKEVAKLVVCNTAGAVCVATHASTVSADDMAPGIYVAVAYMADGSKAVAKLAL